MEDLVNIFKSGGSHHAYLIAGEREASKKELLPLLEKNWGIKAARHPDLHVIEAEVFGIDEARRLKELQAQTATGARGKKIFIVSFHTATREAQNSLLKVFEEPTAGTHFFVISQRAHALLPTLLSRAVLVEGVRESAETSRAKKFLKESPAPRLAVVEDLLKEESKEKVLSFLNAVEDVLRARFSVGEFPEKFADIEQGRAYLAGRAPSVKMILEHLALTLPRV